MFKGCHFPSEIMLDTVRYYLAYKLSHHEIEEIQSERGTVVDHATINRWIIKISPVLEQRTRRKKKSVSDSWLSNETYIKVKDRWVYFRAVDKFGNVIYYYLSSNRD